MMYSLIKHTTVSAFLLLLSTVLVSTESLAPRVSAAQVSTLTFVAAVAGIALAPLWFQRRSPANGATVALDFKPWWFAWIAGWGVLALLTTAKLPYGVPQPLRFPALFTAPVAIGAFLLFAVPRVRNAIGSIPILSLVKWQQCRLIGGTFLVGAGFGSVSVPFAIIAGIGDMLVGTAAIFTARRMQQEPERATVLARRHAWFGMADFASAVTTAFVTGAVIGWPYNMIPLFLVPIAILGHLATFQRH